MSSAAYPLDSQCTDLTGVERYSVQREP
jgi:hypothetical protein